MASFARAECHDRLYKTRISMNHHQFITNVLSDAGAER